jgi:hypothetical protein
MSKKISCLALGAMLLVLSFPAEGQQAKKMLRIGYLSLLAKPSAQDEAFRDT